MKTVRLRLKKFNSKKMFVSLIMTNEMRTAFHHRLYLRLYKISQPLKEQLEKKETNVEM
jgi:hypothetical protein